MFTGASTWSKKAAGSIRTDAGKLSKSNHTPMILSKLRAISRPIVFVVGAIAGNDLPFADGAVWNLLDSVGWNRAEHIQLHQQVANRCSDLSWTEPGRECEREPIELVEGRFRTHREDLGHTTEERIPTVVSGPVPLGQGDGRMMAPSPWSEPDG